MELTQPSEPPTQPPPKEISRTRKIWNNWRAEINVGTFLIALLVIVSIINPFFYGRANTIINLQQAPIYAVLAIGEMFVLLVGGIDLSAGAQITAANVLIAIFFSHYHIPFVYSLIFVLLISIAIGFGQGLFSIFFSPPFPFVAPSFIISLAVYYVLPGAMLVMTLGFPIYINSPLYAQLGTTHGLLGLPNPLWIFLAIFIFSFFVLTKTKLGQHIYATGGNSDAARLSGIRLNYVRLFCFAFAGLLYALTGLMFGSTIAEGTITVGPSYVIPAIAAPFLGGVNLGGGEGSVIGATLGAIIVYIVTDILIALGISAYYHDIIVGLIFLAVVFLDFFRRKRSFR